MSAGNVQGHTAADTWAEHAQATLHERGSRAGRARRAVIELLAKQRCCLSAQEIWEELRTDADPPALATVYRALELLHEAGVVQRVDLGPGGARYEPALPGGEHHHHVVCSSCGRITAFEDEALEEAIDALGARLRHRVSAHEVVIRGDCPRCARRRTGPA